MAASMPNGKACAGFTYLGVLLLIAVSSVALAATGTVWSSVAQRDHERQLLWVGSQYAQALRSYYRASPGLAQYPQELADLLQDNRFPEVKHSGFAAEWSGFEGLEHYSDWQFVAEQAFADSPNGAQPQAGAGDTP